jgi:PAS domain S-box-containing protein
MSAGLSTPLHLAANLLAVFAAAGLAIIVWSRPGLPRGTEPPRTRSAQERLVLLGAAAIAIGHALDGALIEASASVVPWLLSGGLVGIALGMSPARLFGGPSRAGALPVGTTGVRSALAGSAVIVPVAPVPAAVLGAVAGATAGVRALLGGRGTVAVGVGLLCWGAERAMAPTWPGLAPWATVAGAVAIAAWLWQASAARLRAKLVTAFVVTLLGVVVLLAVVLSTLGSTSIVEEELRNLELTGAEVAHTISEEWPREAIERAGLLAGVRGTVRDLVETQNQAGLAGVLERIAIGQDFIAILDPEGRVLLSATADVATLQEGSFLLSLAGSEPVDRLVAGTREDGGLVTVGGQVVAIGGVLVFEEEELRPEDPPAFIVVTGRIADDVWAAQTAAQLPLELLVAVGNQLSAASGAVAGTPPDEVVDALPTGVDAATVPVGNRDLFAASVPLIEPHLGEEVARIIPVRSGEVLAQVERDQARQLFAIALMGGILAGLVTAAVSGRLVEPVRRLTVAAAAVREGDLDVQADVGSSDEVGELGRTFDEMTASLSAQAGQLREAADVQSRLRARLEALNASMSDALVAVDGDGKVVTFNPAAERLVGRAVDDVLGLPLAEVLVGAGPDGANVAEALGEPHSERVSAVQLVLASSDGRVIPTAATAAPVRDGAGGVLGRVLVLRDVTRETEIERMKTEFLSNVSHELRTPLTPIKGYAEVLARRDVGPEATQRFAAQILDSTARLERIVGMIVDFAALDSGRMRPQLAAVDVGEVVAKTIERWRARDPARAITRRVARDLPPVLADEAMLHRCLDELVDNAVKFSPGGEPVSITAAEAEPGPDGTPRVRLSVRDRGVGIETDTVSVFGDFFQADASETRHFGGLGLGLALVRRILDAVEADATVESAPGEGSTFHLLLWAAEEVDADG